jgi:hypothetical protein
MLRTSYILAAEQIERRLEFAHVPQGWVAVGAIVLLAALIWLIIFLYRRERRAGTTLRQRMLLSGLRCAVIVLLAVVWLQPVLARYMHRQLESVTLVLVDSSASMSVADTYPDREDRERVHRALGEETANGGDVSKSRLAVAGRVLERDRGRLLHELAEKNTVELGLFGDDYRRIGQPGPALDSEGAQGGEAQSRAGTPLLEEAEARAPATDLGRSLRQAVESHAGKPIAAVVVVSDGQFNRGEPTEVIARYARSRKIPIHTVGVGDPSPARNLTVTAIEAPSNVFVKDPFQVTAFVRAEGLKDTSIPVELLERRGEADELIGVATKEATVDAEGRIEPVTFTHELAEAQETRLVVRVPLLEGEVVQEDNRQETKVRALEDKMRVLLVSGGPSWEYRYLMRLLERDATVDVSCWLQSAGERAVRDGNTVIDHLPREREELFEYDCVILMDPRPEAFDPAWAANVEAMVGSFGSGLLYVAGRTYTPRFMHSADTAAIIQILPVSIDASASDLVLNELGHTQQTAWPLSVPAEAASHPVLSLSDQPGESMRTWSQLAGVYWHYPVRRAKPAATVLLRHSNPRMRDPDGGHVLLATQFYGSGRTGYLAFDTTWRWRRMGDRYFNRFWIRLLRHLVEGKLLSGEKRGLLQTERESYAVGEPVMVEARLLDTRYQPLDRPRVEAAVRMEDRLIETIELDAQTERPGWYRGRWVPTGTGLHEIQIDLPGSEGVAPARIQSAVQVHPPDLEFRQTRLDRGSLQTLAAESAGGEYLDIDEVGRLTELIPSRRASLVLTGQVDHLWDRWWTLMILVALLGTEWALRKRLHML